jgi:hypothetical protein
MAINPSQAALAFALRQEAERQGRPIQQSGMGGGMGGGMSPAMSSPDYATANQTFNTENNGIRQQRALAAQMMNQASEGPGIVRAGNVSAPGANIFSGLAQGLRGYMGGRGIAEAREQEAGVLEQQGRRDEAAAGVASYEAQIAQEAADLAQSNSTRDYDFDVSEGAANRASKEGIAAANRISNQEVARLNAAADGLGPNTPFAGKSEFAQTANAMWPAARSAGMTMEAFKQNVSQQLMEAETTVSTPEGTNVTKGVDFGFIPESETPQSALPQTTGVPLASAANVPFEKPTEFTEKKKTESEKRADLVTGALSAHDVAAGDYTPGFWESLATDITEDKLPAATGYFQSDEYKKMDTNADEWARMLVFLRSGATARQEEVTAARKNFWPKASDSKEERDRKTKMRQGAMNNARTSYQTREGSEPPSSAPAGGSNSSLTLEQKKAKLAELKRG